MAQGRRLEKTSVPPSEAGTRPEGTALTSASLGGWHSAARLARNAEKTGCLAHSRLAGIVL
jgi:hypothetical protein